MYVCSECYLQEVLDFVEGLGNVECRSLCTALGLDSRLVAKEWVSERLYDG